MNLRGIAAITGMGELKPSRSPEGKTTLALLARAARLAWEDAGLQKRDIDGLLVGPPTEDSAFMWPQQVSEYLQLFPRFLGLVEMGGASAAGCISRAMTAIAAGQARHVLCLTGGVWDTSIFNTLEARAAVMSSIEREFDLPYGPMGFNSAYAMAAQRHMYEYGTTAEQLAKIAVDQRFNACACPEALFYGQPISIDDVLNSPLIVSPLHLLEIVMPCSGASAMVVSAADSVQDLAQPPVYVLGIGEYCSHNGIAQVPDITITPIRIAANMAYRMAGVTPADIDFLSVYDCYTITVLLTLEDAGFCAKGEGGPFVLDTDLTYRGDLPCNTHGGQLSWGQPSYAGGMSHITEAVRQIRGSAGERQVEHRDLAFVNGNGGSLSQQCSLILGRER
ncbi:MAG: thiolase family protein [Syntrophomonadaceae bacterium]|nr:thiolase family protein [Syntrophomonadaceae bacterium]